MSSALSTIESRPKPIDVPRVRLRDPLESILRFLSPEDRFTLRLQLALYYNTGGNPPKTGYKAVDRVRSLRRGSHVQEVINTDRWSGPEEKKLIVSMDHFAYEDALVVMIVLRHLGISTICYVGAQAQGVFQKRPHLVERVKEGGIHLVPLTKDPTKEIAEAELRSIGDIIEKGEGPFVALATGNRLGELSPMLISHLVLAYELGIPFHPLIHGPIVGQELSSQWGNYPPEKKEDYLKTARENPGVVVNLVEPYTVEGDVYDTKTRRKIKKETEQIRIDARQELHQHQLENSPRSLLARLVSPFTS